MNCIRNTILLMVVFTFEYSNANTEQHGGRSFLQIFNIIRLNPNARFAVGVQLTFPISAFMPDLGILGRHSKSYFSTKSHRLWSQPSATFASCPSKGVSVEEYLHLMLIDEEPCQELFICEMSADPDKFMPLSELLLKKISFNKNTIQQSSHLINTTEYNLIWAAKVGADFNQECQKVYRKCPVGVEAMINMNILWCWQLLSKFLNVKFMGETEANILNK